MGNETLMVTTTGQFAKWRILQFLLERDGHLTKLLRLHLNIALNSSRFLTLVLAIMGSFKTVELPL